MDISFNNIDELYKRVLPALRSKLKELKRNGTSYVKEEDIWNFLIENRWKDSHGLKLNEIVNDILNIENEKLVLYVQSRMRKLRRVLNKDTNII